LEEAVAYARGEAKASGYRVHVPAKVDVRAIRTKLGMTQEEFAHEIAVTVSTVNRWENAHAEPSKLAWKAIRDLARQRGLPATGATTTSATY
jgi:DNA-binding transcriptional regulator YiaG